MMRSLAVALIALTIALPAFGKTHKDTYPMPCNELWPAVQDTLSNPDNYAIQNKNDALMTASYNVKHAAHVTITGALTQRTNQVTLVSKGTGCEMQVISNYSGFEHNDSGDFKTRVDQSLAKLKGAAPGEPAKPDDAVKSTPVTMPAK